MSDLETYDTPKPPVQVNYASRPWSRTSQQNSRSEDACSYDVPRSMTSHQNMTPSSSNSSLLTPDSLSLSSSNRSSLVNMPDYDIPRRFPRSATPSSTMPFAGHNMQQSMNHPQSTYDIPAAAAAQAKLKSKKELPLELSSALETLAKLQNEATGAITK